MDIEGERKGSGREGRGGGGGGVGSGRFGVGVEGGRWRGRVGCGGRVAGLLGFGG